jgi:hypothetical protein
VSLDLELEPLRLPWDLGLTPEQFERVCHATPETVLELAADGHVTASAMHLDFSL